MKKEAEEALEKGKKEKTNEIVRRMKNADLSIEQIAQIVELKVDEVKAILNDEKEILTVSTYLDGNYGHSGLYIGVPAILGNKGVNDILDIPLSEEEQKKFDCSFEVLENMKKEIDNEIF